MTRSEVAEEAGIEYNEAVRNLDELYRKKLVRRKAMSIATGELNREGRLS